MKNFVNLKIDRKEFGSQFNQIHRLNPKAFGFTEWTSEIDLACDEFYPDFQPQYQVEFSFARSEENFRTFIANIIPEIEKYC